MSLQLFFFVAYVKYMESARYFSPEAILSFYEIATPAFQQARNDPFFRYWKAHPFSSSQDLPTSKLCNLSVISYEEKNKRLLLYARNNPYFFIATHSLSFSLRRIPRFFIAMHSPLRNCDAFSSPSLRGHEVPEAISSLSDCQGVLCTTCNDWLIKVFIQLK